jgi:hypothetical protein
VSQTSRSSFAALRLTLRAQPRSRKFRLGHYPLFDSSPRPTPKAFSALKFVEIREIRVRTIAASRIILILAGASRAVLLKPNVAACIRVLPKSAKRFKFQHAGVWRGQMVVHKFPPGPIVSSRV